jgi:outer membrane protein
VNQDNLYPTATNPTSDPFNQNILFRDLQIQTGLKQDTATGGSVQLQYQTDMFDRSGPNFSFKSLTQNLINGNTAANRAGFRRQDPFWTNSLQLQVKQPLLQNFGAAANEARIAIARNTQKSSALDFRIQLEKSLAELEKDYWQLVAAEQDVRIRESLLDTTRGVAGLLKQRIGTPGTTNTELSQADEAVRNREFDLLQSQAQVEKLSNTIKAVLNDPDLPVSGAELILPADLPTDQPIVFDVQEQINTALAYRPELSQQQIKIDSAEITVRAAKNNELPQLDLVGQIGLDGFQHTFDGAVRDQLRFDFIDYTLGFQFQVPIGNREARAITTRTQLQRLQAIYQYRGLVDKVSADVKNAIVDVETSWSQIVSARHWRMAAEEEVRRLENDRKARPEGMSPSLIQTELDAQLRLAEARRQEVESMASYSASLAGLEQAKGTLLRYDNVVMEEEPQRTIPLTGDKDAWKIWKK